MFIILIALGVFTIVLSRQNFLQKKYPLKVEFSEIGGMREGDHVFLRGTQVGVIKSTHLENDRVIVTTDLDVPVHFRQGYKVEVVASSMLGGKMMKIYEGPVRAPPLPDSAVIVGEAPVDVLEELGIAVAGIRRLSDSVTAGEGTLGKFLKDESMYDQFSTIVSNLTTASQRLIDGRSTLSRLLSEDDTLYVDLQTSAENVRKITERLAQKQGTLGKLLAGDDTIYPDLQEAAANIRDLTGKMAAGDGTLGRLMTDDRIYTDAQQLIEELRAAVDDMRETSPVTTFSSVFFGAF
jgi:phospholipid/cholesterol/gamma-HCH transport system substrate-binding protein